MKRGSSSHSSQNVNGPDCEKSGLQIILFHSIDIAIKKLYCLIGYPGNVGYNISDMHYKQNNVDTYISKKLEISWIVIILIRVLTVHLETT